ncbi:MAG TPA: hypothetical protein VHC22_05665 [Pirellulales bacterium]|nr:hypothetical protein [Pirellulales bacterium]
MVDSKAKSPSSTAPFELAIVAHGSASLSAEELVALRQRSIDRFSAQLRPQLLKHSDEQTLAAAVALDRAIGQMAQCPCFAEWAVVSATQYLGRAAFAAVVDKYQIDGPWGVSVQVIPHTSPHAVASTLSMGLASHGPSIGAGTAPGEEPQAVLTAATLLKRADIAGAWIVFSGWSYKPKTADASPQPTCVAAVLAVSLPHVAAGADTASVGRIMIQTRPRLEESEPDQRATENLTQWLVSAGNSPRSAAPCCHSFSTAGMSLSIELGAPAHRAPAATVAIEPRARDSGHLARSPCQPQPALEP